MLKILNKKKIRFIVDAVCYIGINRKLTFMLNNFIRIVIYIKKRKEKNKRTHKNQCTTYLVRK